jgi:hypothetical protein
MIAHYSTDSPEALAAIASSEPKNVWIHGSITYVSTGADYAPPVAPSTTA